MTDKDKQLLAELEYGIISTETFHKYFSVDILNNPGFVRTEIKNALDSGDLDEFETALCLILLSGDINRFVDILNELLIDPNHQSHQLIIKSLQDYAPSPTSITFIKKALESNFDYLQYTGSDDAAIAKWFSWLLYAIGTKEAIELMKEYSICDNKDISKEMAYRLSKIDFEDN